MNTQHLTPEQTLSIINIHSQIHSCTACSLHATCKSPVPFRSSTSPPHTVVALGEAPGSDEDEDDQNSPFVGQSGRALDYHAKQSGLIITAHLNTLCCRPPKNKLPSPITPYLEACRQNLATQIQFLKPSIILCLGYTAASAFIHSPNASHRGQFVDIPSDVLGHHCLIFYTYHPAYLLRDRSTIPEFQRHLKHVALVERAIDLFSMPIAEAVESIGPCSIILDNPTILNAKTDYAPARLKKMAKVPKDGARQLYLESLDRDQACDVEFEGMF